MDPSTIVAIISAVVAIATALFQYLGKRNSASREDFESITHKYEELNKLYHTAVTDMKQRLDFANDTIDKLTRQVADLKRSLKEEFDIRRKLEKRLKELEDS